MSNKIMCEIVNSIDIGDLFEQTLNTISNGIIIIDNENTILFINDIGKNLINHIYNFGKSIEIKGQNMMFLFPQLRMLNPESTFDTIYKNRKIELSIDNNGVDFEIEFIFNTMISNSRFFHVVNFMDKKEDEIKKTKCDECFAEKSIMMNKNLMGYLSHELRNPLQTMGFANCLIQNHLKKNMCECFDKIKGNFANVNKACSEMKTIINDVMDLTKIEANELVINMDLEKIDEMIIDIYNEYLDKAEHVGLKLKYNIDEDVPKTIYTDMTRINQIFGNLISNAIKYSIEGEINIDVKYDIDRHGVLFKIIDQGIGIREDEINRLFKEFGQTSNSFKFNIDSNGLGLCISQKIANLLGGNITVSSEYGKGSMFTLFHPIKLGISGKMLKKHIEPEIINVSGNILLVDDNDSNLELFELMLKKLNEDNNNKLNILSASNGYIAIELCKTNIIDMIFMDINMPVINGYDTTKIIRSNGYNGHIVAATGNIITKDSHEDIAHFDDIIIKPFDDFVIMNIIKKHMEPK